MSRKETSRREYNTLATMLILGVVLAACTPEGQAQETRPAMTQTIDGLDVPGESEEAIIETITEITTNTPEHTATPENTPTITATATPEATPTPKGKELPDSISFDPRYQVERSNFPISDRGGYKMLAMPIKFRPQDIHYDEPFTMLNDRFVIQVWTDAWFQERVRNANGEWEDGQVYHISVPIMVYDTQKHALWRMGQHVVSDFSQSLPASKKNAINMFTGPASENGFVEPQINSMCLTNTGDRSCGEIYSVRIGPDIISPQALSSNAFRVNALPNVEFWQDIIEGVYTQEKIDQFAENPDLSLFKLNLEQDLPINLIIPMFAN